MAMSAILELDADLAVLGPTSFVHKQGLCPQNGLRASLRAAASRAAEAAGAKAIVGGLGVSGDSACADHNIACRTRDLLKPDFVPGGVAPGGSDNIIYDVTDGTSAGGFGHPEWSPAATLIGNALPTSNPLGS